MGDSWRDLIYAARVLRQSSGFTLIAVVVLAIGIGANCAIFTLVDAALLRPLPFGHPNQLVQMWEKPPGNTRNMVSPLNFLDWSEQNQVFASMAGVFALIAWDDTFNPSSVLWGIRPSTMT